MFLFDFRRAEREHRRSRCFAYRRNRGIVPLILLLLLMLWQVFLAERKRLDLHRCTAHMKELLLAANR